VNYQQHGDAGGPSDGLPAFLPVHNAITDGTGVRIVEDELRSFEADLVFGAVTPVSFLRPTQRAWSPYDSAITE